jgi:mycothiol synthase
VQVAPSANHSANHSWADDVPLAMIRLRTVETDADRERWRQVRLGIVPNERAASVEEMRRAARPDRLLLFAERDGEVVGSGTAGPSDLAGAGYVVPRVLPGVRRQGIGTVLLHRLAEHVSGLGFGIASAGVDDPDSLAFAERFGFAEVDRQVEQVRPIGAEPVPVLPDGVRIVSVAERPELWRVTYERVALEAFEDFAVTAPMHASLEQWETDWINEPASMFVALAGDEVIGTSGLMLDTDQPERAELALTAVRREWRRRGVASALKRWTHAWAARNGISEVYTWTQCGNEDMRRLNTHLGYTTRTESISLRAPLPLSR